MPSSAGRKLPARALAYGSISRAAAVEALPVLGVERAVGLEVIKLPGPDAGHEDAPDVAPAVRSRVEVDRSRPARGRSTSSYSSTRIAVAERLKTTNCTPPSWRIAPYGSG